MILHIMYDEKIISRTISDFETALPGGNKFIVILARNAKPKYVLDDEPYIIKTRYGNNEFWKAVGDVSSYDYIILHNLGSPSFRFVLKINHPRIVWSAWGVDLYGWYLIPRGYKIAYDENLTKACSKSSSFSFKDICNYLFKKYYNKKRIEVLKKIAYISTIDDEITLLKKYYPEAHHIEKKHFFNYAVDEIFSPEQLDNKNIGNSIMVGNSASLNGNHIEIFNILSKLELNGREILCPLSYGNEKYRDVIIDKGKFLYGDLFVPITEFMPLALYIDTMQKARTFIYGNYRQEAMGNIVMALCWGGAVFMHPSNALLSHFKKMGCTVFSTSELADKLHYELSEEEKRKNKEIILKYYNKERLINIIKERFGSNSY